MLVLGLTCRLGCHLPLGNVLAFFSEDNVCISFICSKCIVSLGYIKMYLCTTHWHVSTIIVHTVHTLSLVIRLEMDHKGMKWNTCHVTLTMAVNIIIQFGKMYSKEVTTQKI